MRNGSEIPRSQIHDLSFRLMLAMRCVCWPVCLFGDVFAHGRFGDFVGIGLSGRDFLRGHVLLKLARQKVHDYDLVSSVAAALV